MLNLYSSANRQIQFLIICLLITVPSLSSAGWTGMYGEKILQINAFASQAFVITDNNNLLGNSKDNGSTDFREIGLSSSFKFNRKIRMAAQLLSRVAGKTDNGNISLDFALLDYRIIENNHYATGFRLGRIKNPLGIYNETRDVPMTRESILLPESIYFERTRDIALSSDGVEWYGNRNFSLGNIGLRVIAANPRSDDRNTESALFSSDLPGKLEGDPSYLTRIYYANKSDTIRVGFTNVMLNLDYIPNSAIENFTTRESIMFELNILSFQFDYRQFSLASEYARRKLKFSSQFASPESLYVPPFLLDNTGESYYVQLVYHWSHRWRLLLRYDVLFQNKNDKDGKSYAASFQALGSPRAAHTQFAKDTTFGVQWSISPSWLIASELHWVDGTAWLSLKDNPDNNKILRRWRAGLISVTYKY